MNQQRDNERTTPQTQQHQGQPDRGGSGKNPQGERQQQAGDGQRPNDQGQNPAANKKPGDQPPTR